MSGRGITKITLYSVQVSQSTRGVAHAIHSTTAAGAHKVAAAACKAAQPLYTAARAAKHAPAGFMHGLQSVKEGAEQAVGAVEHAVEASACAVHDAACHARQALQQQAHRAAEASASLGHTTKLGVKKVSKPAAESFWKAEHTLESQTGTVLGTIGQVARRSVAGIRQGHSAVLNVLFGIQEWAESFFTALFQLTRDTVFGGTARVMRAISIPAGQWHKAKAAAPAAQESVSIAKGQLHEVLSGASERVWQATAAVSGAAAGIKGRSIESLSAPVKAPYQVAKEAAADVKARYAVSGSEVQTPAAAIAKASTSLGTAVRRLVGSTGRKVEDSVHAGQSRLKQSAHMVEDSFERAFHSGEEELRRAAAGASVRVCLRCK